MLCYHNILFRNRAKKILIRCFPKMQCNCKGLTLHLYSLSLYICCRLFLFSVVAPCSFQAQLSDTLLCVNLYFHIHFRMHRPETSFLENRTKIQHHRSTKVMPLSTDSCELSQLILGCTATPSDPLLIKLVRNYDLLKLPLPLHAEELLTCAENKYLYPQLRI